ncbi:MAG: tetratricopeptide repeat protein [Ardenticatenaceae bacterium]|nr:tetratricopeptide repeat protein [Ardenticatenaceae bacterium]
MITLTIPLRDIIIDPQDNPDLLALPEAEAVALLTQAYAFLDAPLTIRLEAETAVIEADLSSADPADKNIVRLREKAAREASRGRYSRAVKLYDQILSQAPLLVEIRRDKGMSLLEMGQPAEARENIRQALALKPTDPYSLLLMGNIHFPTSQKTAEQFFTRAAQYAPEDPYILSNLASVLAKQEKYAEAIPLFEQALTADPSYPNAGSGLALVYMHQDQYWQAVAALDALFAQPASVDIRSEGVYQEAWRLYRRANLELVKANPEKYMAYVRQLRDEVEASGGVEIELVPDNSIGTMAVAEIAWHHNRSRHVVRYKDSAPTIVPHLLAHELEHINLETAARLADNNRFFITNPETRETAETAVLPEISQLKRSGALGDMLDTFVSQILSGLANQLFNLPLDMVIEHALYHNHPELRPVQLVSLTQTMGDNLQVLNDSQVKRLTPRLIYNANLTMNAAYAVFTDHLYNGRTNFTDPYESTRYLRPGRELFSLWLATMEDFQPGDEYDLVDMMASQLKLEGWYDWRKDEKRPVEEVGGASNEELLKEKEPAAIMYCLSALRRFEKLNRDQIYPIVSEIALLGQRGLDYADPEQKYSLNSIPGEQFSGLQLMCLMYVGFKDIEPTLDLGFDLSNPYHLALQLHQDEA